jgi:general secretion pathway protein D
VALFAIAATAWPGLVRGQAVEVAGDSVRISLVNTDMRAAIQAIGRFLTKPVLAGPLGEIRVEVFETPVAIPREAVPDILRGLVEANGLVFVEDSSFYRVTAPEPVVTETPADAGPGADAVNFRLFTVRLRHARAADVAATLNQLFGSGLDFSRPAGLSTGSLSDQLRADREGRGAQEALAPGPQGALLESPVTIVPDELTNSLLVRSTQADFDVLEEGIQQLDVRPLQVLIEVVVVEARKDRQFALGFNVQLPPYEVDGATVEGELLGGGLGDLVVRVMELGRAQVNAVLTAARLRGDVDIVSRPVLLASNNTEASLLVGTQQPFVQVSRSLPTETPQRDQVVQYRDVGTKLTVRPTINQDGYVSLYVQQELSAATGENQFNAPVIASREATTQVLVGDGQTIVIGGLRDQVQDRVRTGVPLLADIPLLGGLFGGTQTRSTEIELFLFITPTIIADDGDIARATMERVPERFLEEEFIGTGPIRPPEISPQVPDTAQCDPDDPECVR